MAFIHKQLAAFARNLERYASLVKNLTQHIRVGKSLRNDIELCIWARNAAGDYYISFDQFLKPKQVPDVTFHA